MDKTVNQLISAETIRALIAARHADVYSVLGMHYIAEADSLVVRVFLPQAEAVEVIDLASQESVKTLQSIHPAGLFVGEIADYHTPFDYALRVHHQSTSKDIRDLYSFPSSLDEQQVVAFCQGTSLEAYQWMGAHQRRHQGILGMSFVLWAPNAQRVSVVGDFNQWDGRTHVMRKHPNASLWEIFIPNLAIDVSYKYEIMASNGHILPLKSDPYAFSTFNIVEQVSSTHPPQYLWQDQTWCEQRDASVEERYQQAMSIYEVDLSAWRKHPPATTGSSTANQFFTYRELASQLLPYVIDMGFTHIQLMPVSEYPYDGSWGYQPIGLFAPTTRFGTPNDFKYLIDQCHQQGIGVIIDWIPGHFPSDAQAKQRFDGDCIYEYEDARQGFHPDWKRLIYQYGRKEVQSYLISNAVYWLKQFHVDGLRVNAINSMSHLDYSHEENRWVPNIHSQRENLEAVELLKQVNQHIVEHYPGSLIIAEESTAWTDVSQPIDDGGLGFVYKWNTRWVNDTLQYMRRDPIYRQYHHNEMTLGPTYSFSEHYILSLSHEQVTQNKHSLLNQMFGDHWQQFANLRAYYGFMWTHPGKKLLFMGSEFAQTGEWDNHSCLDWQLLTYKHHLGVQQLVKDLNRLYCKLPALHRYDCEQSGFQWLVPHNNVQSIFIFWRQARGHDSGVLVVVNMTPLTHFNFQIGVPKYGYYRECLNTDSLYYGGSNVGNQGGVSAVRTSHDGHQQSICINIPPLSTVIFESQSN